MNRGFVRGFTLIELMVVLAIVGVLLAVALPAYNAQVRHSRRTTAIQVMNDYMLREERWRADHPAFATSNADLTALKFVATVPDSPYTYAITAAPAAADVTITATTSTTDQGKDQQDGVGCGTLTIVRVSTAPLATRSPTQCFK